LDGSPRPRSPAHSAAHVGRIFAQVLEVPVSDPVGLGARACGPAGAQRQRCRAPPARLAARLRPAIISYCTEGEAGNPFRAIPEAPTGSTTACGRGDAKSVRAIGSPGDAGRCSSLISTPRPGAYEAWDSVKGCKMYIYKLQRDHARRAGRYAPAAGGFRYGSVPCARKRARHRAPRAPSGRQGRRGFTGGGGRPGGRGARCAPALNPTGSQRGRGQEP
jgi:uncharacterized membrane protein YgcG